ncbi:MAG: response regulator [Tidjanibacter sp.]|nr:response regulator [Tidjanibacter sp.]
MKRYCILIFALLVALFAQAEQYVDVSVRHLTTQQGLASNSVRHIYQDSNGLVWFGTLNSGLSRYDGNTFSTIFPDYGDDITLADSRISFIQEDNNNHLWVLTRSDEVSCYDLKNERFVDFTGCGAYDDKYGYIAFIGDEVWLWGKTQGCRVVRFNGEEFSSEAFSVACGNIASDFVHFVCGGTDGRVWIGTERGLYLYADGGVVSMNIDEPVLRANTLCETDYFLTKSGVIYRYAPTENRVEICQRILSRNEEVLYTGDLVYDDCWIIFSSEGGYRYTPEGNRLRREHSAFDVKNGKVLRNSQGNYLVYNGTQKVVYADVKNLKIKELLTAVRRTGDTAIERYSFLEDSRGMIWISSHLNGLYLYNPKNDSMQRIEIAEQGSDIQLHMIEDRSGTLWVATEFAGVFSLNPISEMAEYLHLARGSRNEYANWVRTLALVNDELWLCTRDGMVHIYDAHSLQHKKTEDYEANIYAVTTDSDGVRWVGSRLKGLQIGGKYYYNIPSDSTSIASNNIYCVEQDQSKRMWIGTFGGGLNLAYRTAKGNYQFRQFFNKSYGQSRVRAICCDKRGYMWAGTNDGVIIFHPDSLLQNADNYYLYNSHNRKLRSNEVRSIVEDSKGRIWIAETGIGFSVCTPNGDYGEIKLKRYGVEQGLISGMVQSFVEDRIGNIWITTEYGVSCFNPEDEFFQSYICSSETQSNVCCEDAALALPDGRIAVGTNSGLAVISPSKISKDAPQAKVLFTDLKVNGISVSPSEPDSPINSSMIYTPDVHLAYDQNSIVVSFSTLDNSHFTDVQYSYKLEGYDNEWSRPSDLSFATYKNLAPGRYHLLVKANNSMGVWSEDFSTLNIHVRSPWYRTTWAYIVFVMIVLVILYMVYRTLMHVNELRNKIAIEQQLTEYKLVFFTNISHEFRTPLTLILSALERMRRTTSLPLEVYDAMQVMEKGSHRMMRLVNQLLEFRKMQNNKLALSLEKTDVVAYLHEIWLLFKDAAAAKNIDLQFNTQLASYSMYIDKGMVDKVAYNLLSNALKYTPTGGVIEFGISLDEPNHRLMIRVTDNGIGVPADKRNQLFSRFMQSSFSANSVGVGLHLTHELVTLHKGTITYEENRGGGSIFEVQLPTDSSIFAESDFLLPSALDKQQERVAEEVVVQNVDISDSVVASAPINPQRILIIEDDIDVRTVIADELRHWFEVVPVSDGEEGLKYLQENSDIDLIVCDVRMPGINGFDLTQRLKKDFATCHIPIVLLTALSSPENHLKGIESGADAYITKPFSARLVLARVLKLLEQRSRLKEKFSNDLSVKSSILCTTERDKDFMNRLNSTLEAQIENPNYSIEDFASEMAMGRSSFYNKVRSITGYSPNEYIRVIRLKRAAELLLTTQMTSAEISFKVGIHDPSYFSKCFKEQFGVTPKVYRKQVENTQ